VGYKLLRVVILFTLVLAVIAFTETRPFKSAFSYFSLSFYPIGMQNAFSIDGKADVFNGVTKVFKLVGVLVGLSKSSSKSKILFVFCIRQII